MQSFQSLHRDRLVPSGRRRGAVGGGEGGAGDGEGGRGGRRGARLLPLPRGQLPQLLLDGVVRERDEGDGQDELKQSKSSDSILFFG